jgi:ankyrin repeat protein
MDIGADINAQTKILRTTLSKCCWNGQHKFVEMVLMDPKADMSLKDSQGRTALHMAVWGQYGGR